MIENDFFKINIYNKLENDGIKCFILYCCIVFLYIDGNFYYIIKLFYLNIELCVWFNDKYIDWFCCSVGVW